MGAHKLLEQLKDANMAVLNNAVVAGGFPPDSCERLHPGGPDGIHARYRWDGMLSGKLQAELGPAAPAPSGPFNEAAAPAVDPLPAPSPGFERGSY